jgi:hypothetical protein
MSRKLEDKKGGPISAKYRVGRARKSFRATAKDEQKGGEGKDNGKVDDSAASEDEGTG